MHCDRFHSSIYKGTLDNKCVRPAVRTLYKTKAYQSRFGVMQHRHRTAYHAAVNLYRDWWNPKISEHFARRH